MKMNLENGVYTIPCEVNDLRMRFILDTGASSVCISSTEALFMLKNGYLSDEDIKGLSKSQIANGELLENVRINLKKIKVGSAILHNIEAVIIDSDKAPLLLGLSALNKLGKWSMTDGFLVLHDVNNTEEIQEVITKVDFIESNELERIFSQGVAYYNKEQYKKAVECFTKGMNLGSVKCRSFLARCYYYGDGVKKDYNLAFSLSSKSAERFPLAMRILALCYFNGRGCQKNFAEAEFWMEKAAKAGDSRSQYILAYTYYFGSDGYEKDYKKSLFWCKQLVNERNALGLGLMGRMYSDGECVEKNYKEAVSLYYDAIHNYQSDDPNEKKYYKAKLAVFQSELASIFYEGGYGIDADKQMALYYTKESANNGYPHAMYVLGVFYLNGDIVRQSKREARIWFKKAAKLGHPKAKIMLESM